MNTSREPEPWRLADDQLAALIGACEQELSRAYADMLGVLAEAERRGLAARKGYRDTAALVVDAARVSPAEARTRLAHAAATVAGPSPGGLGATAPLAATGAALRDGAINREHLRVIHRLFRHCPDHVTPEQRAHDERVLLDTAAQAPPRAVETVATRIATWWDQDGRDPAGEQREQAAPSRELHLHTGRTGRLRFSGELDPESAAQLTGLLGPLAKPDPADPATGRPDPRTLAQRQGDALAEIIDLAARADELATQGGERAILIATVTLAELQGRARDAMLDVPGCTSVAQLLRLACEARVVPAVFGNQGEILHLGTSRREPTAAQRRALALRDGGCARPGCTRKPKWCAAHHIRWWVKGGPTDIDNLVLLCGRHHREIHHTEWEVVMNNGIPEFIPPKWLDPKQKAIRNTVHARAVAR